MKQLETKTVTIGDVTFYVRPFAAFTASNIMGQLSAIVGPLMGCLLPVASSYYTNMNKSSTTTSTNIFDQDLDNITPALTGAFSTLSGDKIELIFKQLFIQHGNISFDNPNTGKTEKLTEDLANEVFCGATEDMFLLAIEVIKINYSGFFRKLATQFGSAITETKAQASMVNMAN